MHETVILGAVRTPIGRYRGALSGIRPDDLLAFTIEGLLRRTGIDPREVSEVVAGCANQAGEDNRNVARMAWLAAGLPHEVPAITVNRLCASGLDAVIHGARAIAVGECEVVIAGGVESMTRSPWVMPKAEVAFPNGHQLLYDTTLGWRFPNPRLEARFPLESMGETAENIAEAFGISREEQDAFALQSHRRAVAAMDTGGFADEILPVTLPSPSAKVDAEPSPFTRDEGPRRDTTLEKLQKLRPAFRQGGTVTAGNASTLNDGAAAVLLASAQRAKAWGMQPLATVVGAASAGVDPRTMGMGPVPATQKLLARQGVSVGDLELVEVNEAFAAQVLAVMRELGLGEDRVNVNGGAIALGHPLGCSGARILTTLVHAMNRRGVATGLATLCVGVGQGCSVLLRR